MAPKKKQHFDDDDSTWHTIYGETIKFKDVTQQHWSNIVHYGIDNLSMRMIKQGINQLIKRFDGHILPGKEYKPPKPKRKLLLTTEDNYPIYDDMNPETIIYTIQFGTRNSIKVRSLANLNSAYPNVIKFYYSKTERDEYYILTTPILSITELLAIKKGKQYTGDFTPLKVGEAKAAARKKVHI